MLKFMTKYVAKGTMSEPIYDECPEIGERSFDINHTFCRDEIFNVTKISDNCYELYNCDKYGVSVHGSTVRVSLSVEELISKGILVETTAEQYNQMKKCEILERELEKSNCRVALMYEAAHFDCCSPEDIENYVSSIIENIHALGAYTRAKLSAGE